MMMMWGTVSWAQAWMTNRAGFYVTRALIGMLEYVANPLFLVFFN